VIEERSFANHGERVLQTRACEALIARYVRKMEANKRHVTAFARAKVRRVQTSLIAIFGAKYAGFAAPGTCHVRVGIGA